MDGIIHVAGVMPRIGTTTVALQLILFLKRMGYKAAYVEMNVQDYIWGVTALYQECVKDKVPGRVTYYGIDLYSKERFTGLTSGGTHYDYIICDYGNMQVKMFDIKKFTNCGAMILVTGSKPNEIFYTESALKDKTLEQAIYVFSFIRKEDEGDILEMMQNRANQTAFMPYSPDPFIAEIEKADHTFYYPADLCFQKVMDHVVELLEEGGKYG